MICTQCGTLGDGTKLKGSGWIELVLWFCYIVPGLLYSIWRRQGRSNVCQSCGGTPLVPTTSPVGVQLMQRFYPAPPPDTTPRPFVI